MPEKTPDPKEAARLVSLARGLKEWGGWVASIIGGLVTVTAAAVAIYLGAKGDVASVKAETAAISAQVSGLEARVAVLETSGSPKLAAEVAALKAARDDDSEARRELLRRMRSVEQLLAQLVCKSEGPASATCERALGAIGPTP